MNNKAVIYCRVSTKKSCLKLASQLYRCRKLAKNNNYKVHKTISEIGIVIKSNQLPGYLEVLQLIRSKEIDCLIVDEVHRISRNIYEFSKMNKLLKDNKVRLISSSACLDDYDFSSIFKGLLAYYEERPRSLASKSRNINRKRQIKK